MIILQESYRHIYIIPNFWKNKNFVGNFVEKVEARVIFTLFIKNIW